MPQNDSLQTFLEKRDELVTNQENILISCKQSSRVMTKEESENYENWNNEIADLENHIEKIKSFENKVKDSELKNAKTSTLNKEDNANDNDGFENLGEFCQAVAKFRLNGTLDKRFTNAASGHSANVPSDGGFLLSPTKSNEILRRVYEGGEMTKDCTILTVGKNSDTYEVPYVDETSRATGSRWGGLRVYREGETDTPTSSKTKLGKWECRVSDMKALVYVTDRLLEDASQLEGLINEQIDQEFQFKLEDEIVRGAGGSQCHGIIGNPATISVAKETGQAADTVLFENIIKMFSRCWGRSRNRAKWYINQDLEPELFSMAMSVGTGGVPVYLPANGVSESPYNTLMGKPVVPIEQCDTVGTVGDIIFGDMKEYAIVKKGGMKQASSIHVKFLTDEMTFKFSMRVNGRPKWKSALTPYKGTNTLSPWVTLASRD